jgi:hypothetical protein
MRRQLATPAAGAEKSVASNVPEAPRSQPLAAAPAVATPAASVEPLLPPSSATEPAPDLAPSAAASNKRPPVPAPAVHARVPPPLAKNTGSASGTAITDFGGRR